MTINKGYKENTFHLPEVTVLVRSSFQSTSSPDVLYDTSSLIAYTMLNVDAYEES